MTEFHWAGFGSGSGTNLEALAEVKPPSVIVCDRPKAGLLEKASLANVPKIVLNGYKACGSWKKAQGNPEAEAKYKRRSLAFNEQILGALRAFEQEKGIELNALLLGGYMRLVMSPLLEAYQDRIWNVHPSPLPLENGKRRFIGDNAVYDTIAALHAEGRPLVTRSTVIAVDAGVDAGEIIVSGPWSVYEGALPPTQESCDTFQSRLKEESDWPAFKKALEGLIAGDFTFSKQRHPDGKRVVVYQGKEMPYGGVEL